MRHLLLFLLTLIQSSKAEFTCPIKEPISVTPGDPFYDLKPDVNGAKKFLGGVVAEWSGPVEDVTSPIIDTSTGSRAVIGKLAQMGVKEAEEAVAKAQDAWKNGQGAWPQSTLEQRITAMENVVLSLQEKRDDIINVLAWEICKTADDAAAEFGNFCC